MPLSDSLNSICIDRIVDFLILAPSGVSVMMKMVWQTDVTLETQNKCAGKNICRQHKMLSH